MFPSKDGCRCYDETTLPCSVHNKVDHYQCGICNYAISDVEWNSLEFKDVGCPRCDNNMSEVYRPVYQPKAVSTPKQRLY
jgi:hypothetical protein